MFQILFLFVLICQFPSYFANYEEIYTCSDGSQSDYRLLLFSPQKNFMFELLLENATSRSPIGKGIKLLPHPTTVTGFVRGSQKCLTIIETPQVFSHLEVIDTVDEIYVRCFDSILIMINVTDGNSPLTSRESEMLVSTLKLMESLYSKNLWRQIEVVFWLSQSQDVATSSYKSWFIENIQIPVTGIVNEKLVFHTIDSKKQVLLLQKLENHKIVGNGLEQQNPNFLSKSGIPWIGQPSGIATNKLEFEMVLDLFILVENFDEEKLTMQLNGVNIESFPQTVDKLRNDLVHVKVSLSNQDGIVSFKYDDQASINTVDVYFASNSIVWSEWSSWSKCSTIDEEVSRRRILTSAENGNEIDESESRPCYCSDLKQYPKPRILLIGKTGVGKSTLGNQLLGGYKAFASGHDVESKTEEISIYTGNFLGVGECFTIIDTPGARDTKGRDYKHTLEMQKLLKNKIKSFEVILLLTSGTNTRVDGSTIDLMKWYEAVFGSEMWKHVIIEVTFWAHKKADSKKRLKDRKTNESKFQDSLRDKIKEQMNIPANIYIPVTFIDPMVGVFEDPCQEFYSQPEPDERKQFDFYIRQLEVSMSQIPQYDCKVRCLAPDEFFSGGPFVSIPSERVLNIRQGENKTIEWQMWTGVTSDHTISYDVIIDENTIFKKLNGSIYNENESMNELKGFEAVLEESNKIPKVTSVKLSISLSNDARPSLLNFTADLKNQVESESSVQILIAKDAEISEWSNWSACSVSCIKEEDHILGQQTKTRECKSEENGGQSCADLLNLPDIPANSDGIETSTRSCSGGDDETIVFCPVDLVWSEWTEWGFCSTKCGPGNRTRNRICTSGRHGGTVCSRVHESEVEQCILKPECPRNCILGDWSSWSQCTSSCNHHNSNFVGLSSRQRNKNIVQESNAEGVSCAIMAQKETETCMVPFCPVNGVWSSFSDFSPCSVTCDWGEKFSIRHCIGPLYNGANCEGSNKMVVPCKNTECPVDCQYNRWSEWSQCSQACGLGITKRTRSKTDQKFGGKICSDPTEETQQCFQSQCPPSEWSSLACSTNDFDAHQYCRCPTGAPIKSVSSFHSNYHEDRRWTLQCGSVLEGSTTFELPEMTAYDAVFTRRSDPGPGKVGFWSGLKSHHSNYHEDRQFSFMFTVISGYNSVDCRTIKANGYDADVNVNIAFNEVLTQIDSVHSNYHEDREFNFRICKIVKI